MPTAPFPVNPELTAISIAYRNPAHALIADRVMPRLSMAVGTREFKYMEYDLAQAFTVPSTLVGRKGRPNEVDWTANEKPASVEDHALDEPVPLDDIEQGRKQGLDVRGITVEFLTNLILLAREIRVAALANNPANYAAGNTTVLSGTDQFSDTANSNPVEVLQDMLSAPIIRPNVMNMGLAVWTKVRTHPKIVKAIYPGSDGGGMVTREQFRELFELSELNIGEGFLNTARKGQAPNMQRAWGPHISAHFRDTTATNRHGVTWGLTVPYGTRISGSQPDGNIGMRGGERVRVGESLKELVCAKDVGILIQNAVAVQG